MCTAITYRNGDHYFGRTLDYEPSYGEQVVLTPRNFPLMFRHMEGLDSHYAMIGMAYVQQGYPLYYDGANEKGLAVAGLNFVGNAVYCKAAPGRENVAQFEFVPWLLATCATVDDAKERLSRCCITDTAFSEDLLPAQLHWLIADKDRAIAVESTADGLHIYDDPAGVLTNNPPFPQQLLRLNDYMQLSAQPPENRFAPGLKLQTYSRGMGAIGLPGDLSSQSRFVRAAFVRANSSAPQTEEGSVSQFFHILGAVEQQRGCCRLENGECEITIYTSCCNTARGIYYYTTYDNRQITAVDMHSCDLDGNDLSCWPLRLGQQVLYENRENRT